MAFKIYQELDNIHYFLIFRVKHQEQLKNRVNDGQLAQNKIHSKKNRKSHVFIQDWKKSSWFGGLGI